MRTWRTYPGWLVVLMVLGGSVLAYLAALIMVLAIGWGLLSLDRLLTGGAS